MFGLSDNDVALTCVILAQHPAVESAVIFGSRAKGNYRPGSDVDIALKGKQLTTGDLLAISEKLNEQSPMPYYFDILNYETVEHAALTEHIDRIGIIFYTAKEK